MDSDTDDEYELPVWKGVPGTIVLINVFDPLQKNSPVVAHRATCETIRQYLRTSTSQNVGVCLYGVKNSDSSVVEVIPLNVPTLKNFKILQSLDLSTITQAIDLNLSEALRYCSKMFRQSKRQFSTQTVTILTNLMIPPVASDQKAALNSVKDLVDSNIDIKIINISENDYKIDQFYEDFLIEANKGGHDFVLPKPIWDCKEIERVIHQQSHRHLTMAKLNFEIGEDVCIGVGVYRLLKSAGDSFKKSDLDRDTNVVVTSATETVKVTVSDNISPMDVDEEVESKQDPVLDLELLYYQEYGGERIGFTKDEMKRLKNAFGPPMLKLLGFKPSSIMCKERWYLKSSYFLFPSESKVEGSTVAFKALHKACSEMSVVAICVLCTRKNSRHHIVALHPSKNPLNLDIDLGFDVIHIPFAENKRDLSIPEDDEKNVSKSDKQVVKDIINKLNFEYKTDMFENPTQQCKIRAIEAIALDQKDVDPYIDTTRRDPNVFDDIDVNLFEEIFGPFGAVTNKRIADTKAGTSNKRPKIEDFDERLLENSINNKTIHKYTVTQLKNILEFKNVPCPTRSKKEDLVKLVYEHCG